MAPFIIVNFSHFHLLQYHWGNLNQTWHKASSTEIKICPKEGLCPFLAHQAQFEINCTNNLLFKVIFFTCLHINNHYFHMHQPKMYTVLLYCEIFRINIHGFHRLTLPTNYNPHEEINRTRTILWYPRNHTQNIDHHKS